MLFLNFGCVWIMYGAWETYHVSNTHHNLKFRTPELVYVTQTGRRTTDVGSQKSSLNKLSLIYSIIVISLSNTITACRINVPTGDVVSAVVFIVFAARKVTTYWLKNLKNILLFKGRLLFFFFLFFFFKMSVSLKLGLKLSQLKISAVQEHGNCCLGFLLTNLRCVWRQTEFKMLMSVTY